MSKLKKWVLGISVSGIVLVGGAALYGYSTEDGKRWYNSEFGYVKAHNCVKLFKSTCALFKETDGEERPIESNIYSQKEFEYLSVEEAAKAREQREVYLNTAKRNKAEEYALGVFLVWLALLAVALVVAVLVKIFRAMSFYSSVKKKELLARKAEAEATLSRYNKDGE